MRYFKTSNASRPYNAGGLAFHFEPVDQFGGNWLGVLAVDEESTAGILAGAAFPQVTEISAEDYDAIKKKPLSRNSSSYESLRPAQPPPPASVPPPVAPSVESEAAPAETQPVLPEPVAVLLDPPDELKKVEVVKPINKPAARKP